MYIKIQYFSKVTKVSIKYKNLKQKTQKWKDINLIWLYDNYFITNDTFYHSKSLINASETAGETIKFFTNNYILTYYL